MDLPTITESEASVTVALVERVSDRLATGVPLSLALAGEPVSCAEYEEHLRQHPELAGQLGVAKRKFLQNAIKVLLDSKNASANVRWLLEWLYPDAFDRPREGEGVTVNVTATTSASTTATSAVAGMSGMSEEYVKALQEGGKQL